MFRDLGWLVILEASGFSLSLGVLTNFIDNHMYVLLNNPFPQLIRILDL